jgi:zinc/manganese transport system substrate-binding protein
MLRFYTVCVLLLGTFLSQESVATPIHIVAAENFYASVAKEIGGEYVQVESILNQPDQDPHLFNVTPSIAKHISQADLIVSNGLGYDTWMQSLLSISVVSTRTEINVGQLVNKKVGDNPHIWYDPMTMPVYAQALLDFLSTHDPLHQRVYRKNYQHFIKKYGRLLDFIQQLKTQVHGKKVIATEPVFGYMAQALGLDMQGMRFQISMMNGVDPSPKQVQEFYNALQSHTVQILFYNKQVDSPLVQQLLELAKMHAIPIIGVTETQPLNKSYIEWVSDEIRQVAMVYHDTLAQRNLQKN